MIRRLSFSLLLLPVLILAACGSTSSSATTPASVATTSATSPAATGTTSAAASSVTTTGTSSTATSVSASPAVSPQSAASSSSGITFTLDPTKSQASYKARETLANIGSPTDAIGKTSQVSGQIVFTDSGAIAASSSKLTINLATLQSDKSQRDNFIKRNTLNTDTYPNAVFVPTQVQGLSWPLPASGQATFKLIGNLTVHGKTSQTTWNATATFGPQQVQGSATTTVKFEDFGMKPPSTMIVLSVEDNLTLQLDFVFNKAS